jgi:cytochrome c oxidase subunit II
MKIVVDTPEDYKKWSANKQTIVSAYAASKASEEPKETLVPTTVDTTKTETTDAMAAVVMKK